MHPDYDPFVDIAWEDEQTPLLNNSDRPKKGAQDGDELRLGALYRAEGSQWPCYVCAAPTDFFVHKGQYTLRLHPICAIQHKIIEMAKK